MFKDSRILTHRSASSHKNVERDSTAKTDCSKQWKRREPRQSLRCFFMRASNSSISMVPLSSTTIIRVKTHSLALNKAPQAKRTQIHSLSVSQTRTHKAQFAASEFIDVQITLLCAKLRVLFF